MKKFMKKLAKKAEGFTLVELVVVIAILGILAGVAVPAYSGYLKKANEASDMTALDAVLTASQATMATTGAVTSIDVDTNSGVISKVTVNGTVVLDTSDSDSESADFDMFFGTTYPTLKSDTYKTGAVWSSTGTNANKWVKG